MARRIMDIRHALSRLKGWTTAAGIFLVAYVLFLFIGVLPLRADRTALEKRLEEARELRVLSQASRQAEEDLDGFRERLFAREDLIPLLADFSKKARGLGLGLPSLSHTEPARAEGDFLKTTVSIQTAGRYPQLKKYIASLESDDRILVLNELQLASGRDAKTVQASLSVEVYFREKLKEKPQ